MKIDKLTIEMENWGENKGKYIAKVRLKDGNNELFVVLNPDISGRLLPLVVDELCSAAADYASSSRRGSLRIRYWCGEIIHVVDTTSVNGLQGKLPIAGENRSSIVSVTRALLS